MSRPCRSIPAVIARSIVALYPVFVLTALACSDDFDPYGRLTTLRVLAVQSEPVAPAPGETTTLTPLVYTPPGEAILEERWSWCPFAGAAADGAPCMISEAELAALAGTASFPPYDLGAGATAAFEHSIPTSLLDQLCQGAPGQPRLADCTGGFPVQLRFTVRTRAAEVVAVRELRLRREGDAGNANPVIEGLGVVDAADPASDRALTDDAGVTLPREVATSVRARVAPEIAETYEIADDDGQPAARRERLTLTWFVESGDTSAGRTGFIDGIEPLEDALEIEWTPAASAEHPSDLARLIVVLRDNRGGVTWRGATVHLDGAP